MKTCPVIFLAIFDETYWPRQKKRCGYAWKSVKTYKKPAVVANHYGVPLEQIVFIDDRTDVHDVAPPLFQQVLSWSVHDLADNTFELEEYAIKLFCTSL